MDDIAQARPKRRPAEDEPLGGAPAGAADIGTAGSSRGEGIMGMKSMASVAVALCLAGPAFAAPASVDALRGERRVFLVSASAPDDPQLKTQRSDIAGWRDAAQDRDVTVVQIVGDAVQGASDSANALRARYGLPADSFAVALVGKDGHVALRSAKPLSGGDLSRTIDAMPMRRAGER